MEQTASHLLKEVEKTFAEKGFLTDELLSALNFLFPVTLLQALDLIDKKSVSKLASPSGRYVYQVMGSTGTPYICLASCDYCACPAFKFSVVTRGDILWCKHILAIKLASAMKAIDEKSVTDKEMAGIIVNID